MEGFDSQWEAVHRRAARQLVPDSESGERVCKTLQAFCIGEVKQRNPSVCGVDSLSFGFNDIIYRVNCRLSVWKALQLERTTLIQEEKPLS